MFTKYKSEKIFKRIFFNYRHRSLPSKPSSHAQVTPTVTFSSSLGSVTSAVNVVKRFFSSSLSIQQNTLDGFGKIFQASPLFAISLGTYPSLKAIR